MAVTVQRTVVVVAAAAVIWLGFASLDHDQRCATASYRAYAVFLGASARDLEATVRQLEANCSGADELSASVSALLRAGRDDQALRVAHEATRREPSNYVAWLALAAALQPRDASAAARARDRAHALNPRYAPARPGAPRGGGP
ncbi:MAG TPA: tetratricopeptide repeat protein [Solirubrobacteraceae bacterium]|nr:tetratricopeptide repeat protein [Solirubrobacteraceae bacterium]